MFIVDIAVPRDVEPRVAKLEQVFSYNVDDLQDIVHENMENRATEAEHAAKVVDEEVTAFLHWGRTRAAAPVLRELQAHGRGIVAEETQKALHKLGALPPDQQKVVEALAHQVMQKLLHRPMAAVRAAASKDEEGTELAGSLARLFDLANTDAPARDRDEDDDT